MDGLRIRLDNIDGLVHLVGPMGLRYGRTCCGLEFIIDVPLGFDDRWIGEEVEGTATCLWCMRSEPT